MDPRRLILYNHQCSGSLRAPWPASVQEQLGKGVPPLALGPAPRSGKDAAGGGDPTTPPSESTEPSTVPVEPGASPLDATPAADPSPTPTTSAPAEGDAPPAIPGPVPASCSLAGAKSLDSLAWLVILALIRRRAASRA